MKSGGTGMERTDGADNIVMFDLGVLILKKRRKKMSDFNYVAIKGRLTADPVSQQVNSGKILCKFSIASNGWKDEVSFFNCTVWGMLSETIHKTCKKGTSLLVWGRLKQDRWETPQGEKRSAVNLVVEGFNFLEKKQQTEPTESLGTVVDNAPAATYDADDIPF